MARKQLAQIDMNSNKIINLGTPTSSADAVTKAYADALQTTTVNYYQPTVDEFTWSSGSTFTLTASPSAILYVSINGQILQSSEYSNSGTTLTVTPASHTFVSGDIVRAMYRTGTTFSGVTGLSTAIKTVTSNYTVTPYDRTILVDATSANVTVTFPSFSTISGLEINIKKIDSSTNFCYVATTSSQTIDGSSTARGISVQYNSITVQNNGTAGYII